MTEADRNDAARYAVLCKRARLTVYEAVEKHRIERAQVARGILSPTEPAL